MPLSLTLIRQLPGWISPAKPAPVVARKRSVSPTPTSTMWGENLPGVKTKLDTKENAVALTFDLCGSKGDGLDTPLVRFLIQNRIPATLFMSGQWITKHLQLATVLAKHPLFVIENHGENHRPASVSGRSIYGIRGTQHPQDLIAEIMLNAQRIQRLTGKMPQFYRSGTAYYDPQSISIIQKLGMQPVGFSLRGDAGATYTKAQVRQALLNAKPGDITLFHLNHPEKETGLGVIAAIPELQQRGVRFVKLQHYPLI